MPKRKAYSRAKRKTKPARVLTALFLAGVALRFALALLLKYNPTITPDESLYINIAKSLYERGEILINGQPANYAYLLYPFLLLPLYAFLPVGADIFRAAQLLNICLMCSIVFPAYYATKEITGRHDRALTVAIIALILPDMVMSSFLMSESLIYALFFACFYVVALAVKRGKLRYYALAGVIGALMYYTKNFHMLFAAVFLTLMLIANLCMKKYREALYALLGGVILAGASAGLMALSEHAFKLVAPTYNINSAGDVISGLGDMAANIAPYAEGFYMYAAFFTIALGGAYFVMPAFNLRAYSRENRLIALTVGGALAAVVITVLYMIHPATRASAFRARVELRYIAMYIVPLIALSLTRELDDKRLNVFGAAWLALAALYAAVFGMGSGYNLGADVDNHTLAIFAPAFIGGAACRALSFILAALLLLSGAYLLKKGWTERAKRAALMFIAVLFACSNIAAYSMNTKNNYTHVRLDAIEAAKAVDEAGGEALMIVMKHNSAENLILDARAKTTIDVVPYNLFMHKLETSRGVYMPFVPSAGKYNIPDRPLADASLIIYDWRCAPFFQHAPGVIVRYVNGNNYMLATIEKGAPAYTSIFSGLPEGGELPVEAGKAAIRVFDPAARSEAGVVSVSLSAQSPKDGAAVYLNAGNGTSRAALDKGENTIKIRVVTNGETPVNIFARADTPGVCVSAYEVLYE